MSYDLTFLAKSDDQDWEDALEALEEEQGDDGGSPDRAAWDRIVADAREFLGDVELYEDGSYLELDHEATGIQLSLYAREAGIAVPYWYSGQDAERIVALIYRLGLVVERHTGLAGYDGQVGLGVAEAAGQPELAVTIFDQVARSFASRGIVSPSNE
ncbi:hypothetical protein GCM10010112_22400 [Actinoplanes lobatus]|uniref:Uncharacterized protein n=1 Tax=Actinoplanes lobatus TaxID=113568 RepID=A0A7W7HIQ7_9ACTN|nr:hypothetical protein [Actinoplanes lobatus]MBB4751283.1 hypothetical protein [Actinoplanes lobatus]GGN63283.1 hypothetical protein GCM10010112_22400 [Actinoplanes lobatus]GIE44775.1 hypothetical protein Alo02nite_76730 [Actinoplanes lobatus]